MRTYTLPRDRALPLQFTGELLGEEHVVRGRASTTVAIYRTEGGSWVVAVHQRTGERERWAAEVLDGPADVVEWLRRDGKGRVGPASALALQEAAAHAPELATVAVEVVP